MSIDTYETVKIRPQVTNVFMHKSLSLLQHPSVRPIQHYYNLENKNRNHIYSVEFKRVYWAIKLQLGQTSDEIRILNAGNGPVKLEFKRNWGLFTKSCFGCYDVSSCYKLNILGKFVKNWLLLCTLCTLGVVLPQGPHILEFWHFHDVRGDLF